MSDPVKYPRSPHLPWSPGSTDDDKMLSEDDILAWEGRQVVVTEKRDGENTTMTREGVHARSTSLSMGHVSQTKVRALHGLIGNDIPESLRICGENLSAVHTLRYYKLRSCFEVFSVWDGDLSLSWPETEEWAALLGLVTVPVLWSGTFEIKAMRTFHERLDLSRQEGYVVRSVEGFSMKDFRQNLAKFVRKGHVGTDEHWKSKPVEWNEIIDE